MLKITATEYDEIDVGDLLVSINGQPIRDMIDYQFYSADEELALIIQKPDGSQIELEYDAFRHGPPELEFEPDPIKRCKNKCVFCFIHQLPKGLRKSLYVKDEDYRLSFMHGNYVTLTNLDESDFERIISLRMSPLYVSVHTTDEALRRRMLGRKDLPELMPQIKRLVESEIELHTQIVVCPGFNDGDALEKTIADLAEFYPDLRSVAIVPVGLTAHRKRLPKMHSVTHAIAREILDQCQTLQQNYLSRFESRFIYPADEFFLLADQPIPPQNYYEDFPQVENGVGMLRQLLSSRKLPAMELRKTLRATIVTGTLAEPILTRVLADKLRDIPDFEISVLPVENHLMGKSVTVSGLLGGKDIYSALKKIC